MGPSFLLLQLAYLEGELDTMRLVEMLACLVLFLNVGSNFLSSIV